MNKYNLSKLKEKTTKKPCTSSMLLQRRKNCFNLLKYFLVYVINVTDVHNYKRQKMVWEQKGKTNFCKIKKSIRIISDIKEKALEKNCLSICRQQKNKKAKKKLKLN